MISLSELSRLWQMKSLMNEQLNSCNNQMHGHHILLSTYIAKQEVDKHGHEKVSNDMKSIQQH